MTKLQPEKQGNSPILEIDRKKSQELAKNDIFTV